MAVINPGDISPTTLIIPDGGVLGAKDQPNSTTGALIVSGGVLFMFSGAWGPVSGQ